jgi:hypothetical protein
VTEATSRPPNNLAPMLFTYHVTSGTKSYATQHQANGWAGPRDALIGSEAFR